MISGFHDNNRPGTPAMLGYLLLAALMFALLPACAASKPQGTVSYFLTSEIAYLRDTPTYDGNVVAQVFKGDQVERQNGGESDWWQVSSARTGQAGWIQRELLSPRPVPVVYSIASRTAPLRECPGDDCPSLQLLFKGDQVQKVEENDRGWWRVLVKDGRTLGWVTAAAVGERSAEPVAAPEKTPKKTYYYVAVSRLKLRQEPRTAASAVRDLKFNEQLEKLEQNLQGWLKVRHPASGALGWVASRYLTAMPVTAPRRLKPAKKSAPPPPKHKAEPLPELEVM